MWRWCTACVIAVALTGCAQKAAFEELASTSKHRDMSHAPNIVSAMANPYLRPSQSDHHIWSVATDPIKRQVFQTCSCGWKTKVRDFYGAACTYDTAYQWMNHFDVKPGG